MLLRVQWVACRHHAGALLCSGRAADASSAVACRRLRTRLFAGRCVLELPGAVGPDPRHFDLVAAQGGSRGLRQKLTGT